MHVVVHDAEKRTQLGHAFLPARGSNLTKKARFPKVSGNYTGGSPRPDALRIGMS